MEFEMLRTIGLATVGSAGLGYTLYAWAAKRGSGLWYVSSVMIGLGALLLGPALVAYPGGMLVTGAVLACLALLVGGAMLQVRMHIDRRH